MRSTVAILRLVDQIATEIDKGNLTVGVFIDLSKAFDTYFTISYCTYLLLFNADRHIILLDK